MHLHVFVEVTNEMTNTRVPLRQSQAGDVLFENKTNLHKQIITTPHIKTEMNSSQSRRFVGIEYI